MEASRQQQHGDHHGSDAGAGQQRRHGAHRKRQPGAAARGAMAALEAGEVDREDIEERQRQADKDRADGQVEHGRRLQRAEEAARGHDGQAQHAVGQRHAEPVDSPQQETPAARTVLRAGTDDRQVDRDHRQHAGGEVQQQAAHDNQQHGQPPAPRPQKLRRIAGEGRDARDGPHMMHGSLSFSGQEGQEGFRLHIAGGRGRDSQTWQPRRFRSVVRRIRHRRRLRRRTDLAARPDEGVRLGGEADGLGTSLESDGDVPLAGGEDIACGETAAEDLALRIQQWIENARDGDGGQGCGSFAIQPDRPDIRIEIVPFRHLHREPQFGRAFHPAHRSRHDKGRGGPRHAGPCDQDGGQPGEAALNGVPGKPLGVLHGARFRKGGALKLKR